jgi:hypothetical protein
VSDNTDLTDGVGVYLSALETTDPPSDWIDAFSFQFTP